MKLVSISYSKKFNLGNYQTEELGVVLEETEGEAVGVNDLFAMAKAMVEENASPREAIQEPEPPTFSKPQASKPSATSDFYMYLLTGQPAVAAGWEAIKSKRYPGCDMRPGAHGGQKKLFSRVPIPELAQYFNTSHNKINPHTGSVGGAKSYGSNFPDI